jgi:drug/metabolite transporter (DMT)-like permease
MPDFALSAWIASVEGTPEGARVAMYLALFAALMHAIFGALQKGRHDPWLTRGAIDFWVSLMALPLVIWVVPWPEPHMWLLFAGMFVIHQIYKITQGYAYTLGAYTVVYPVVRGLGPLITVAVAGVVFSEHFELLQWAGVLLLTSAIFALALVNLRGARFEDGTVGLALMWAVAGGVMVATYTIYDAYGIRATANPFTFLAWFFFLDGLVFPFFAYARWKRMADQTGGRGLITRGLIGAVVAYFSFGSVMMATRLDKVGEAAVLRETSTAFAAIIGWLFLKEKVGILRAALMVCIALGAVMVEFGG